MNAADATADDDDIL